MAAGQQIQTNYEGVSEMERQAGCEMIITVKAKVEVKDKDAEYWDGLSEYHRGVRIGSVITEIERYFSDELDEDLSYLDVDAVMEKTE